MKIYFIIEFLEFLIFLFLIIKRNKLGKSIDYFIIVMALTFFTEIFGTFWRSFFNKDNIFIYVIGINFFVFLFIYLYFLNLIENKTLKKFQKIIVLLFILNYIFSAIFIGDFFKVFPLETFFVNDLLLLFSIGLFLYETFNSDKILYIKDYYPFWVSIALIVIYIGLLPLLIISSKANSLMTMKIYTGMVFFVNLLGYGLMLIGIFFAKDKTIE